MSTPMLKTDNWLNNNTSYRYVHNTEMSKIENVRIKIMKNKHQGSDGTLIHLLTPVFELKINVFQNQLNAKNGKQHMFNGIQSTIEK